MTESKLIDLNINLLEPNPLQVRSVIKSDSLVDLVESIKQHGILEPLVVAKTPAGYQIIAGERRWRAAKIVGFETVPVIVKETTSMGMLEMALVENVQRENLNPIERAKGFQRLLDEFNLSVTEIAKKIGKSTSYTSNSLRLLALPDAIKDGLVSLDISEGHARALAGLTDTRLMVEVYKIVLAENASVRRTEELVRRMKEKVAPLTETKKKNGPQRIKSSELENLAKTLSGHIKATAKISQSTVSGKIVLLFKGNPELTTKSIKSTVENLLQISAEN